MGPKSKKRKATTVPAPAPAPASAPAVAVKQELNQAAARDAAEAQARRREEGPLTEAIVNEKLDRLWNKWMDTPARSKLRRVRLQHEFPGGMAACSRARALRAAIDTATDNAEWKRLKLELCTLLWLAQDAHRRMHLATTHEDWFPLPTSSQGEGGGVAEEMDLTEQCNSTQPDPIDMTVLPPPALLPQERKLLVDQLQKMLDARARYSHLNTDKGLQKLVNEYLRFMTLKRAAPPQSLSPSTYVDDAWHCHIICTREYAAFCERHFGSYVHHNPTLNPRGGRYQACLEAYRAQYPRGPPPSCWPEPGDDDYGGGGSADDSDDTEATGSGSAEDGSSADESDGGENVFVTRADVEGDFGARVAALGGDPVTLLREPMPRGERVYTLEYLEQNRARLGAVVASPQERGVGPYPLASLLGMRRGKRYYGLEDMDTELMDEREEQGLNRMDFLGESKDTTNYSAACG